MIIKLTKYNRNTVEAFADAREKDQGAFYKNKRGAFKREDIVCGALAEIAAYRCLVKRGVSPSKPDFAIHKKKSFAADLKCNKFFYHIKGQTLDSESKYGNSYLCQKSDKLVSAPKKNDIIICCVVDLDLNQVTIVGEYFANAIVWGEPKISWLKRYKAALYIEDQL